MADDNKIIKQSPTPFLPQMQYQAADEIEKMLTKFDMSYFKFGEDINKNQP